MAGRFVRWGDLGALGGPSASGVGVGWGGVEEGVCVWAVSVPSSAPVVVGVR